MNISTFTKFLSVAVLGSGLAFANNIVVYNTVSNTNTDTVLDTNRITFGKTGPNALKMVGKSIGITSLSRLLPNPTVNLSCVNCTLNFVTGLNTGYTPGGFGPGGAPLNPSWSFASGGSASIVGSIDLNGDNVLNALDGDIVNQTLLTGSFINSANASSIAANGDTRIATGLILNSQNTTLNQYLFGNPFGGPVWTGSMNIVFNPFGTRPVGSTVALPTFSSKAIISGSLVNSAVPEPGSVLLFSSITAILGIGVARRRRQQQNNA